MTIKVLSDSDNNFSRLGLWYIVALSTIATIIITGQLLIQNFLNDQKSDARVINVSGRQRMLSQRISKLALMALADVEGKNAASVLRELEPAVKEWESAQNGLIYGNDSLALPGKNSSKVSAKFNENLAYFNPVLTNAKGVIKKLKKDPQSYSIENEVNGILENEQQFLSTMNEIVYLYEEEAQAKLQTLRWTELALLAISLIVIFLEIQFIFRPTARQVNKTLMRLIRSEKQAQKMAAEIGALYQSLEKSYEEITSVNIPDSSPKLIARTDKGGNISFISTEYLDKIGIGEYSDKNSIIDLFPNANLDDEYRDDIIDNIAEGKNFRDMIHFVTDGGRELFIKIIITPVFSANDEVSQLLVIANDITERKKVELNMHNKNRADIERKINEQKYRSVLILEGQEEERKRLAMDLHDGIGQMLTSLKFHTSSIDLGNASDARLKLSEINRQMKDLIKEVRRVTFNLKPMVLSDFGLLPGLAEYAKEMNKLNDVEINFTNKSQQKERLPQKVENNIYRILQEAVNNAIKYADTDRIDITVQNKENSLIFEVRDFGKGIEPSKLIVNKPSVESGHGLFNMHERSAYINGNLDIHTSDNQGTRVVLEVPVLE